MTDPQIRFVDGASYERFMGQWSQQVGTEFLHWLAPEPGWRWLDVGCGNGAFTELLVERCVPASIDGIDPAPAQIEYARARASLQQATFRQGDAMAMPYADASFDAAVMPLVIFFVTEPARGVAEMVRVVRPGGVVAAYAWDMANAGFPYAALHDEMRAFGMTIGMPPSPEASRDDLLRALWSDAGLVDVHTREITATRTYASMDEYWEIISGWRTIAAQFAEQPAGVVDRLRARMEEVLQPAADGTVTWRATANAVTGRVPA